MVFSSYRTMYSVMWKSSRPDSYLRRIPLRPANISFKYFFDWVRLKHLYRNYFRLFHYIFPRAESFDLMVGFSIFGV